MTDTYTGRCPKTDKILLRRTCNEFVNADVSIRCPSCQESFHEVGQLDWRQR